MLPSFSTGIEIGEESVQAIFDSCMWISDRSRSIFRKMVFFMISKLIKTP